MAKIIYFTAPWCGPCKALGPVMDKLSLEIPIHKVNIDNDMEKAAHYSVRSVPTLVKVDDSNNEIKRTVGNQSREDILNWYNG
ncbi:MAG: thioredoxin family protein [Alteromonadales bacterium]|nr:thioredoxin family protein [Alteromonadales bacterium]|tara:strand:+ start:765 stop:1013 length:249 start_codon:yes stop_codon:yes gene_type:complete